MKICKNCKAESEDNQNFCYRCGSSEFEVSENIVSENAEEISVKTKNKKKLLKIIIPIVAAIVVIGIVAVVIAAVSNSNSLWKEPFSDTDYYGYCVTPEEFIKKDNELKFEGNHSFEYDECEELSGEERTCQRYYYDIQSLDTIPGGGYFSSCAVDYYDDNTIRKTSICFPYNDVWTFEFAYNDICTSAVQLLYAYGAFDADSAQDVLSTFISRYDTFLEDYKSLLDGEPIKNAFLYNDFSFYLYESENSEALLMEITKCDEDIINNFEASNNVSIPNIAIDADLYKQSDADANTLTEAADSKLKPEDCIADSEALYERVKPFFEKYGYDIDSWDVTVDNGTLFSAETDSEMLLIDENNLAINLNRGGNSNRGLFVIYTNGNPNFQLCFSGEDRDKAFELLDIIFENAVVDDKPLSTYIQDEYEKNVDVQYETAQWQNEKVNYMIQLKDDYTFLMLGFKD